MRIAPESTTVHQYFNEKWQMGLISSLGVSVDTAVQNIWIVDNPARPYHLPEKGIIRLQSREIPKTGIQHTGYPVSINWNWFSLETNPASRLRLDYHADEDILYILNQENQRPSLSVYDVMQSYPAK